MPRSRRARDRAPRARRPHRPRGHEARVRRHLEPGDAAGERAAPGADALAPPAGCTGAATSKNIIDTALALQIKDTYAVVEAELDGIAVILARPGREASRHVMAGRTHGQHALPITFGYKVAVWLDEVLPPARAAPGQPAARAGGGAGRRGGHDGLAGPRGPARAAQADAAARPGRARECPTKTAGDRFAEFFLLLCLLSGTLGKIAQNIYNLQVTDVDEATEFVEGKVGSSAMPHKLNPVASGSVVLLGRHAARAGRARSSTTSTPSGRTTTGRARRPGPSPPRCACSWARSSSSPSGCSSTLVVKPENMARNLERSGGVVMSELVMMALARQDRPRPGARAGAGDRAGRGGAPRRRSATRWPPTRRSGGA